MRQPLGPMAQGSDAWYVLLPDGQVLRAASTQALRQHVGSGRIPPASRVRRSPDDEWVGLEWAEEFADLAAQQTSRPAPVPLRQAPAGVAARFDPMRLHTVGVRALLDELLAAMDSTLVRAKLVI